ncbi:D-alanine aminotransferase, partial [Rheinheimera baltica]|nr:D-alanine aminotransferase [Rheinheimera baltica]
MTTVYLNGSFIPASEAKISPMDRGFLFGDGIYEVIPSYGSRFVGFGPHIDRMHSGLAQLSIDPKLSLSDWQQIADTLIADN